MDDSKARSTRETAGIAAVGGLAAAIGATSCCILPLALFSIGASGAWIGQLSALAPYQPIFITVALGFLGFGFWRVYGRPARECTADVLCARPLPRRLVKTGLWTATVLVAAAIAFDVAAPLLLA